MKLHKIVTQYVTYRKSLGEKFINNEQRLTAFVRTIGPERNLLDVKPKEINAFLAGEGPLTANWHVKYQALNGFYRYVLSRGYAKTSPLPISIPKLPKTFVPYIYTAQELKALLDASLIYQKIRGRYKPCMVRMLLLILYGAGLRLGEAINLTLADVDLSQALLIIRGTKFNKTRLVPLGAQLTQSLSQYAIQRQQDGHSQNPQTPFFIGNNGKAIKKVTFQAVFALIREKASVRRTDHDRFHPRLHDLRHTFAVHRLMEWYKEGADVQKWLPVLSVYLGHTQLAATSVYLTMTPALLEEAGRRFQNYAFKEDSHD